MLTPDDLERLYFTYSSLRWRGDPAGESLEQWLRLHWVDVSPCEPDADPEAISPHGAGGRGIRWYACASSIIGVVPGKSGCYLVKETESLPQPEVRRAARVALPAPRPSVAHFQSGTYARYLPTHAAAAERSTK